MTSSSSASDGASVVTVTKGGLCKKCNVDGLSDKDSAYSNKHESEEEEEMEELEEIGEEEDAYLEVIH